MNLSQIFNEIQLSPQSKTMVDLLKLNEKTKEYGLVLKPNDVKNLVVSRNKVLHDHARVELGIEVLKELIEVFSTSPIWTKIIMLKRLMSFRRSFIILEMKRKIRLAM